MRFTAGPRKAHGREGGLGTPAGTLADITIRPFTIEDYEPVYALWRSLEGIGLSDADEPAAIAAFLGRNPGLSLVAFDGATVAGAVLAGHDGRRGYLYHCAVAAPYRRRGLGRELAARCLVALAREGIQKCHLFVYTANDDAQGFWEAAGWERRGDILVMSHAVEPR